MSIPERTVRVEMEVISLRRTVEEHKLAVQQDLAEINNKLDDLLALRNKGIGVFWLASAVFGTTLISIIALIIDWIKQ